MFCEWVVAFVCAVGGVLDAVAITLHVNCSALAALQDNARMLQQLFTQFSAADGPVQAGCCKNTPMPVFLFADQGMF